MKVLYDARFITPYPTGIGHYTKLLLNNLFSLSNLEIVPIIHQQPELAQQIDATVNAPVAFDSHPMGDIWRNTTLIKLMKKMRIEIFHSPAFYSIQRKIPIPQIVGIHDLAVFQKNQTFNRRFIFYFRRLIINAAKRADCIITSTHYMADEIANKFPQSKNKIRVIPYGIDARYHHHNKSDNGVIREKYCLPQKYLLDVATIEPRKNLVNLLDAYSIYRRRSHAPLPLIIVGKDGYQAEIVKKRARKSDLHASVRFLGYVPENEMPAIYSMADIFIFPSIYEGFGIPIIEAMASETPVVSSNISSIPEVCGECAVLINPRSPLAIATAILKLENEKVMKMELIEKGKLRSANYTWEKNAEETAECYKDVINN